MSERQVQYTDGSWSREVEVTDDLLDEATRYAGDYADYHHDYGMARVLNELIQRVQQAEAARQEWADLWQQASMSVLRLTDERDVARGKLDKVRRLIPTENPELIDAGYGIDSGDVLAILDGKTGD